MYRFARTCSGNSHERGITRFECLALCTSTVFTIACINVIAVGLSQDEREQRSAANLKEIATAHALYAVEWNDRQVTFINDSLATYGNSEAEAISGYEEMLGEPPMQALLGQVTRDDQPVFLPFRFSGIPLAFDGGRKGWGAHRLINAHPLNSLMNGRFYDPVWYAPKDDAVVKAVTPCLEQERGACLRAEGHQMMESSYSLSAAAMFDPRVLGYGLKGEDGAPSPTWTDPWKLAPSMKSPTVGSVAFPELKTRTIEHHWLNGGDGRGCNPAVTGGHYDGCQPYFFNASADSAPLCLMFDGSVRQISVREASAAHERAKRQNGRGLWSDGCPTLPDFFHDQASGDSAELSSFHVLTTDGVKGRDVDARR